MTETEKSKTLILGIGNDILMDDAIGPRLVADLQGPLPQWGGGPTPQHCGAGRGGAQIVFKTTTLGGLDILELIQDYERVIFIDAIKTKGGVPGTVYQFTPQDFQETLHLSNLHDVSFLEAIEMGKQLGLPIPTSIHIIAVEIVEDMEFGLEFTPIVKEKYPKIVEEVTNRIGQLLTVDVYC